MNEETLVKKTKENRKKEKGFWYVLMHRDKKGRKSLVLLLFLLLTVVLLSTSVYAWFTANYVVSVTDLDVTVASGSGIQISTDAINWKSLVTSSELLAASSTYADAVNQVPTRVNSGTILNPVSTVNAVSAVNGYKAGGETTKSLQGLKMYLGTVTNNTLGNYILTATEESDRNGNTGNYLAFDVFIKSDFSSNTTLYLTKNTSVKGYTVNSGMDTDIEYASRIAIIDEGNTQSSSTTATMQALNAGSSAIFIEPNYDVHTATGVNHASNVYGITTYATTAEYNTANTTSLNYQPALAYSGVKAPIAANQTDYSTSEATGVKWGDATATNYSSLFGDVTIDKLIASDNDTSATGAHTELLTLKPGVTKLRIYMWIEGQDIDCENKASGGTLIFNLGFEVDEPAANNP